MSVKAADAKTREKLKAVRDTLAEQRAQRTELQREYDSCREAFGNAELEPGADLTATSEFQEAEQAAKVLGECKDKISQFETAESAILRMLGSDESVPNGNGPTGAAVERRAYGDGHEMLKHSEGLREIQPIIHSDTHFGTVTLGELCEREDFHAFARGRLAELPTAPPGPITTNDGSAFHTPDARGIQPIVLRPLTLLDVIPFGTTNSNVIEYTQVTGLPSGAKEVAELALKPEMGMTFQDQTANVRTIAGWIKVSRYALDDMAGLATMINTLLPHDVRRRLEGQILAGDGTGVNLRGIANTTGTGSVTAAAEDTVPDTLLKAITSLVMTDQSANFAVLNPVDWAGVAMAKDASGQYLFGFPGMFGATSVYGLTIVQSRLIAQGTAIVGDSSGATVLVRAGVTIKTTDSDQDDFVKNRVTILAEGRFAFPVWAPSAFVEVDLTAT